MKNTPFCELWEAMGGGRASHDSTHMALEHPNLHTMASSSTADREGEHCELRLSLSLRLPHLHTSKRGVDAGRGLMSAPTRCPEEDQHACHLRLPFVGPCRVSTPLRRGGNGEEVRTCGVCAMDQILLRRSRDEHTPARSSAERIPSHLSVACAEACDIVPPFFRFSLMIL